MKQMLMGFEHELAIAFKARLRAPSNGVSASTRDEHLKRKGYFVALARHRQGSKKTRRIVFNLLAVLLVIWPAAPASADDNPPGRMRLTNVESDKCLDQDYSGGVPHATVQAWQCITGGTNQYWEVTQGIIIHTGPLPGPEDNTVHRLKNVRSGQCLDQNYTSGVEHRDVIAFTCRGNADTNPSLNQYWRLAAQSV